VADWSVRDPEADFAGVIDQFRRKLTAQPSCFAAKAATATISFSVKFGQ